MRRKVKKDKKLRLETLTFFCLITTIIVTALTLSKYETTTAGNDNAVVAIPIISLSVSQSNTSNIKISPNIKEQEYIISVSNTEELIRTEVAMEYTLTVKSLGNLPLEFELYECEYDESTKGLQETGVNLFTENGSSTSSIKIDIENDTTQNYKLKIKWQENSDSTSYKYSNTLDYVQIVLDSNQVD